MHSRMVISSLSLSASAFLARGRSHGVSLLGRFLVRVGFGMGSLLGGLAFASAFALRLVARRFLRLGL
jgi:hypothetical protein